MREEIYLAGGCFWGLQHYFDLAPGVLETEVGYANSKIADPSYEQVCSGGTDAAETVKVIYDDDKIPLENVLDLFFHAIDPTQKNRQGNDVGTQYRSGIYAAKESDLAIARKVADRIGQRYARPVATEVKRLENFYPAEEYHQEYLDKNPRGYCHIGKEAFDYARNYTIPTA